MAINEEWGRRLRDAKSDWERAHGHQRLSYSAIGEAVAKLVGRAEPFSHTAVAAWFKKGQEPDSFTVAQAIEQVLGQPPGALILGGTAGRAGGLEPRIVGPVSEEEKRASAARRAAKKKNATRRGRAS